MGTKERVNPIIRCWRLEILFPKLVPAGYEKTSDETGLPPKEGAYNCIAWAASDIHRGFWWPDENNYWPCWSERQETIANFVKAFKWLGYRVCDNSRLESGFEKIALYALGDVPKHMARQLKDNSWTSKCGGYEDITHYTLDAVESYGPYPPHAIYGCPVLFMKRLRVIGSLVNATRVTTWKFSTIIGAA
jgi:hypothetical protein